MIFIPPFYLTGETGKSLGLDVYSLAALGVQDATLSLRSLDVDTLTFSLRDNGNRPAIPDDGQWLTLKDDAGQTLFTGIAKRSFAYPARIYSYEVSNVYKGLLETSLLAANGRPFVAFDSESLTTRIHSILTAAVAAGLPLLAEAVGSMPVFYAVPKCAFRAASLASALEDTLKWAPDAGSRMDYATTPPTLKIYSRTAGVNTTVALSSEGHAVTTIDLTSYPEARALGVAFVYAERDGEKLINYRVQQAGNDAAEARRKISIYLSGGERTDMMTSEALSSSINARDLANSALAVANAAVAAVNAQATQAYLDALAGVPSVPDSFNVLGYLLANDAALAAYPSMGWRTASGLNPGGYLSPGWGLGGTDANYVSFTKTGVGYSIGGYPVASNPFSSTELSRAGATATTGYLTGNVVSERAVGETYNGFSQWCVYYGAGHYVSEAYANADYHRWVYHPVNQAVTFLSKAPSAIRSANLAWINANQPGTSVSPDVGSSSLIDRAEFVEAPPDLAANYFTRQDWTPYKGSLTLAPSAPDFPAPGDFLSVTGDGTPAEWAAMKCPVAELSLDLRTGAATVTIGPSPRMDFSSLVDRLRIPPEDNYQPG